MFRQVEQNNTSEVIDTSKVQETVLIHFGSSIFHVGKGTILSGEVTLDDLKVVTMTFRVFQIQNGFIGIIGQSENKAFYFKPIRNGTFLLKDKTGDYVAIFDITDIKNDFPDIDRSGVIKVNNDVSAKASDILITTSGTQEELNKIRIKAAIKKAKKNRDAAQSSQNPRTEGEAQNDATGMELLI